MVIKEADADCGRRRIHFKDNCFSRPACPAAADEDEDGGGVARCKGVRAEA